MHLGRFARDRLKPRGGQRSGRGTDLVTAEDAQQARLNAVREAFGHRTDATNQRNEGLAARANAKGINPMGAAATSLLGSATSMASSYYGMRKAGG